MLGILAELRKLPRETEWAEFKHNRAEPDEIGEYLSALANAAQPLAWPLDDSAICRSPSARERSQIATR